MQVLAITTWAIAFIIGIQTFCDAPVAPLVEEKLIDRVVVSPDSLTLNVGDLGQATCTPSTAKRPVLNGCNWLARDSSIVRVTTTTQTTQITARKEGTTWVVASAKGKRDSLWVQVCTPQAGGGLHINIFAVLLPCIQYVSPATTIAPGDNWQTKANAGTTNTQFRVLAGTHTNATVIPKTGQQFLCDPGAIMDGTNTTSRAIWIGSTAPYPNNVVIRGCEVKRYNPPFQYAAIQSSFDSEADGASGWIVDNVDCHHSLQVCIRIGTGMIVRQSKVHHNTTFGITGPGSNVLIDADSIYANGDSTNAESAATKFVLTHNLIVRNNWVFDNQGPGIWLDIANDGFLVEKNTSTNNWSEGIVIEISYGGIIRNNTVSRSGMRSSRSSGFIWNAGIGIHASGGGNDGYNPGIEVADNTLLGNAQCISLLEQPRGAAFPSEPTSIDDTMQVWNVHVHRNTCTMQTVPGTLIGASLGAILGADQNTGAMYNKVVRGITVDSNTISLNGVAFPFAWNNGFRNRTYWTGTVGFDTHSSITN